MSAMEQTITLSAFIKACKEEKIFIHDGIGKLNLQELVMKDVHYKDLLSTDLGASLRDVFIDRKDRTFLPLTIDQFGKPCGCIWFSNGTWLRDPFCDCETEEEFNAVRPTRRPVIITKSPNKILEINTKEEFIAFCEEYCKVIEYLGKLYKDYRYIDWDKVAGMGYYGIYFSFKKSYEIGLTSEEHHKYSWHDGMDVESLIVWDNRAFNEFYVINLVID